MLTTSFCDPLSQRCPTNYTNTLHRPGSYILPQPQPGQDHLHTALGHPHPYSHSHYYGHVAGMEPDRRLDHRDVSRTYAGPSKGDKACAQTNFGATARELMATIGRRSLPPGSNGCLWLPASKRWRVRLAAGTTLFWSRRRRRGQGMLLLRRGGSRFQWLRLPTAQGCPAPAYSHQFISGDLDAPVLPWLD